MPVVGGVSIMGCWHSSEVIETWWNLCYDEDFDKISHYPRIDMESVEDLLNGVSYYAHY